MNPGDLVVCVNARPIHGLRNTELHRITHGDVYTVADICIDPAFPEVRKGYFGVRLIEVPLFGDWDWWHSTRFRPCRKTDISALMECAKEREREVVE